MSTLSLHGRPAAPRGRPPLLPGPSRVTATALREDDVDAGDGPRSLPVVWVQERSTMPGVGKLELLSDRLRLEGRQDGRLVTAEIPLASIHTARLARGADPRIGGRATLVIERLARPALLVSAFFGGVGVLGELADRLPG